MSEPTPPPRTAAYLRVSTKKQDETMQREVIERWLQSRNIDIKDVQWFTDKASGKTLSNRPQFARLQEAVYRRQVDLVVMYSLDRFARVMIAGLVELERWEQEAVTLVFVADSLTVEPNSPIGRVVTRIMVAVTLAIAEAERERIRQRARDGYQKQVEQQRRVKNRATIGMDYRRIADLEKIPASRVKRMVDAPDGSLWWSVHSGHRKASEAECVQLFDAGLRRKQIARALDVHVDTVRNYLRAAKKRGELLCRRPRF